MISNWLYGVVITFLISHVNSEVAQDPSFVKGNQTEVKGYDNSIAKCICNELYEPVCASDGKTYGNTCGLNCYRKRDPYLFGLCKGECPCCKEPYYNEPIADPAGGYWGWNKDTGAPHHIAPPEAPSKMEPDMELTAIADNDRKINCYPDVPTPGCICYFIYRPVCGSDGKTYGNDCVLACRQRVQPCLTKVCDGACPCCGCSLETKIISLDAPVYHNVTLTTSSL